MKITKKTSVNSSRTIESIEWGKTAVVPESTIQAIANDIQDHLDSVYPELNLECFVDLVKDYRDYQVFHVHTYPAHMFEPVLKYRVYLHDTTVAHMWDNITEEFDLDLRADYADTVCDIITEHVNTLKSSVVSSSHNVEYFFQVPAENFRVYSPAFDVSQLTVGKQIQVRGFDGLVTITQIHSHPEYNTYGEIQGIRITDGRNYYDLWFDTESLREEGYVGGNLKKISFPHSVSSSKE